MGYEQPHLTYARMADRLGSMTTGRILDIEACTAREKRVLASYEKHPDYRPFNLVLLSVRVAVITELERRHYRSTWEWIDTAPNPSPAETKAIFANHLEYVRSPKVC